MLRHELDIRRIIRQSSHSEESSTEDGQSDEGRDDKSGEEDVRVVGEERQQHRYPRRERTPPAWMADYEMGEDY